MGQEILYPIPTRGGSVPYEFTQNYGLSLYGGIPLEIQQNFWTIDAILNTLSQQTEAESGIQGQITYYPETGTTIGPDPNLDDGMTTANTLTYTGSGGVKITTTPDGAIANSPALGWAGVYKNGSAQYVADTWTVSDVLGSGENGQSILTFTHSGTTGETIIDLSAAEVVNVASLQANSEVLIEGNSIVYFDSGSSTPWGLAQLNSTTLSLEYINDNTTNYGTINIVNVAEAPATGPSGITDSPKINLQGWYEATSGPTYGLDTWSLQIIEGTGVNGTSTLTFSHSGTTGTATVSIPNLAVSGTVSSTPTFSGAVTFGSTVDVEGTLTTSTIYLGDFPLTGISNSPALYIQGVYESASTPTYGLDYWTLQTIVGTGVNGRSQLQFAHEGSTGFKSWLLQDAGSAPTSTGTAGTQGEFTYSGGLLYFCSVGGVAGSATWNKLTMTSV
jgi:hypothetical protein